MRLLQKRQGEAFKKIEHVRVEELRYTDSVGKFKKYFEDAYEIIEVIEQGR